MDLNLIFGIKIAEFSTKLKKYEINRFLKHYNTTLTQIGFHHRHNNRKKFKLFYGKLMFLYFLEKELCDQKYKLSDFFNEYHAMKMIEDRKLDEIDNNKATCWIKYLTKKFKTRNKTANFNINLISSVHIQFRKESGTIYTNLSQQYSMVFMFYWRYSFIIVKIFCLFCICAYGKRIFGKNKKKFRLLNSSSIQRMERYYN